MNHMLLFFFRPIVRPQDGSKNNGVGERGGGSKFVYPEMVDDSEQLFEKETVELLNLLHIEI